MLKNGKRVCNDILLLSICKRKVIEWSPSETNVAVTVLNLSGWFVHSIIFNANPLGYWLNCFKRDHLLIN